MRCPPIINASGNLVKSVFEKENGLEEAVFRRANHRFFLQQAEAGVAIAAQQGDTEAMHELIEGYDRLNLQQCWTWFCLAELIGTDLAKDEYRAINEDGSDYDDEVGGPAYLGGRGGVELYPLDANQDASARQAAATLYQAIDMSHAT